MIDVEILNFQAIDKLHVEIDGFTALVGRSNIGKSSIVRALKCALTGSSSSDFVRHDPVTCSRFLRKTKKCQCFSSVRLKFGDEGPTLRWEKGDSINRYTVQKDGTESVYDRVDKNPELPDFVGERFAPVKMGSKHNVLQVSDQFDPLFLLDLSGTVVADTLSDLGQLDAVNKALSFAAKDRREASSVRKTRDGDRQQAEAKLARYVNLDESVLATLTVKAKFRALEEASNRAALATRLLSETTAVVREIQRVGRHLEARVPDVTFLGGAAQRRRAAVTYHEELSSRSAAVDSLGRALEPEVPDASVLRASSAQWRALTRLQGDWASRAAVVGRLEGCRALVVPSLDGLQETFAAWRSVALWLSKIQSIKVVFDKAQKARTTPEPQFEAERVAHQINRLRQVESYGARLQQLEAQEQKISAQLDIAQREEADVLAEFRALGLCPTCSQPLTPVHTGRVAHEPQLLVSD